MVVPIAKNVRIKYGALDDGEGGEIILRGSLDMDTISALRLDTYQRGRLSPGEIAGILQSFREGKQPPDIVLGMRGQRVREGADGVWTLLDDVYIVDGQQRIEAFKLALAEGLKPRLGCMVHFGTDFDWEDAKFKVLNTTQKKVVPAKLIFNEAKRNQFVAMVLAMCEKDVKFPLAGRVCWDQKMQKGHIFRVTALVKSIGYLHAHMGVSYTKASLPLCDELLGLYDRVGRNVLRENIRALYNIIEDCWGIRTIALHGPVFMRGTFLSTMCKVLSDHPVFWQGDSLHLSPQNLKKWRSFPVNDATVKSWAGNGTKIHLPLYEYMVDHLNKGKRVGRLQKRRDAEEMSDDGHSEEAEEPTIRMQRAAKKKKTG